MNARILLVDDDPMLAASLSRPLAYEGFSVQVATTGPGALEAHAAWAPDLILLDLLLPGMHGIEVCRRLRGQSNVPVLMLTARGDVQDRVAGLAAGADDYLAKPFSLEELLLRVHGLLRRTRVTPDPAGESLQFADVRMDVRGHVAWRNGRLLSLTRQEFALLRLFLEHPGEVQTRSHILEQVWDYDFGRESNVLEVYVGYLRRKLEAGGGSRLLHTVRGVGYTLRESLAPEQDGHHEGHPQEGSL